MQQQRSPKISSCEIFAVIRFSTFATKSARSRHGPHGRRGPLSGELRKSDFGAARSVDDQSEKSGRFNRQVGFTPNSGHDLAPPKATLCANNGLMHRSKQDCYSITSSARASSDGGTARPRAFAVLRLMTSSNLVGCSTGISAAFAPFRILST
jgi:hypothetical protein